MADSTESSDANDTRSRPQGLRLFLLLFALSLGMFLIAIDNTIIAVAVPKITTNFHALNDVGWYGSVYLLTLTAFQPSVGKVYKTTNVKWTYLASIVVFEAGSILCAAAPNSVAFILGRAISGAGAAGLMQGALQIITLRTPLEKRPMYFGAVTSVFGLAICFGPILGGVFTDRVTWRWCFWINVPIGGLCLVLVFLFLRLPKASSQVSRGWLAYMYNLDPLGGVLVIASVACLLLTLQWAGSGLLAIAFILVQWKMAEQATVPLRFLRQRSMIMGSLSWFFLYMVNFTDTYFVPFYFQAAQGVSAEKSGIQYIPLVVPQIVALVTAGVLVTKFGHYVPIMIVGECIYAVGTGLLTTLTPHTPTVKWAAYLVISGIGLGLPMQMPFSAFQVVFKGEDIATANAIGIFLSQLGGALAIAIAQSIFVSSLIREVPKLTTAVTPQQVIAVGATNLRALAPDDQVLQALQEAYTKAVNNTLIYATVAACLAVPFACGMEWKVLRPQETISASGTSTAEAPKAE